MARSKSSGRAVRTPGKKSDGGFASFLGNTDENVQLAIVIAVIGALVALTQSGADKTFDVHALKDWKNWHAFLFGDDSSIWAAKNNEWWWPFTTWIFTLHALNHCQGGYRGYWVSAFLDKFISFYAPQFVLSILDESNAQGIGINDIFNDYKIGTFFFIWWFTNHNLPFADFDLWGLIKETGGHIGFQSLMDVASMAFNVKLVTSGYEGRGIKDNSWGKFGFNVPIFVPVARAVAIATASDFFPLSKGINFASCSQIAERAFMIGLFLSVCKVAPGLKDLWDTGNSRDVTTLQGFVKHKDGKCSASIDKDGDGKDDEVKCDGVIWLKPRGALYWCQPTQLVHLCALFMHLFGAHVPQLDSAQNSVIDFLYTATNLQH